LEENDYKIIFNNANLTNEITTLLMNVRRESKDVFMGLKETVENIENKSKTENLNNKNIYDNLKENLTKITDGIYKSLNEIEYDSKNHIIEVLNVINFGLSFNLYSNKDNNKLKSILKQYYSYYTTKTTKEIGLFNKYNMSLYNKITFNYLVTYLIMNTNQSNEVNDLNKNDIKLFKFDYDLFFNKIKQVNEPDCSKLKKELVSDVFVKILNLVKPDCFIEIYKFIQDSYYVDIYISSLKVAFIIEAKSIHFNLINSNNKNFYVCEGINESIQSKVLKKKFNIKTIVLNDFAILYDQQSLISFISNNL